MISSSEEVEISILAVSGEIVYSSVSFITNVIFPSSFLKIEELYGYWSDYTKENHRILYWALPIPVFQVSDDVDFEVELREGDIVSLFDKDSDDIIEYQDGKFVKAIAVDIGERDYEERKFQWRVRTIFKDENVYGIWKSDWSDYNEFVLYARNDLRETERLFEELADGNIYDKDILKLSLEDREKYNIWNIVRYLTLAIEEENWDLERKQLDIDFNEMRDKALSEFSNFHLRMEKKDKEETWSEFRYALLKIKNAFVDWSGRYTAIRGIVEAFTGIEPEINPIKKNPGWVLGDFGSRSFVLTQNYDYSIDENGNANKIKTKSLTGTHKEDVLFHRNTYAFAVAIVVFDPFELLNEEGKEVLERLIKLIVQKHIRVYFEYEIGFPPEVLVWNEGLWDFNVWG